MHNQLLSNTVLHITTTNTISSDMIINAIILIPQLFVLK